MFNSRRAVAVLLALVLACAGIVAFAAYRVDVEDRQFGLVDGCRDRPGRGMIALIFWVIALKAWRQTPPPHGTFATDRAMANQP